MTDVIKLRKGLDIHLQGKAEGKVIQLKSNGQYGLVPEDFVGVVPKVVVREGDHVKAGDALFVNKQYPEVKFASPVSGTVSAWRQTKSKYRLISASRIRRRWTERLW